MPRPLQAPNKRRRCSADQTEHEPKCQFSLRGVCGSECTDPQTPSVYRYTGAVAVVKRTEEEHRDLRQPADRQLGGRSGRAVWWSRADHYRTVV